MSFYNWAALFMAARVSSVAAVVLGGLDEVDFFILF